MSNLIAISILGLVVIVGALSAGVVFSTIIKTFVTKVESTFKNDVVGGYDDIKADYQKISADVKSLEDRTETNVKNSLLSDESFLNSIAEKIKAKV